ncbi:hypothetical protein VULLAG_LOCUS19610 [Vulpes lagopus]
MGFTLFICKVGVIRLFIMRDENELNNTCKMLSTVSGTKMKWDFIEVILPFRANNLVEEKKMGVWLQINVSSDGFWGPFKAISIHVLFPTILNR